MKKYLSLLACLLLTNLSGFSQNTNLVIFSEDGDSFYAYINGIKQNNKAETNIRITGLASNISLRIEFENQTLAQLKQTMMLEPGFEHTARIKRDKKKQLKLRYFGRVPIGEGTANDISSVQYHTSETPAYNTAPEGESNTTLENSNSNTTYQNSTNGNTVRSTTTTTTTTISGRDNNASVTINMGGVGINMNVNSNTPSSNTEVRSTTSTTVINHHTQSDHQRVDNNQAQSQTVGVSDQVQRCSGPMSDASFKKMKESISSKSFSDTKMSTARVATKNACLSVNQVKEICALFSMDDDKLTYARYAYDYCVDKGNYYQVGDVFSFSGTTEEFNTFLEHGNSPAGY
jgi:hypothetical protein